MSDASLAAGAWQVDADRLRATLDDLRRALSRTPVIPVEAVGTALALDQHRVIESLRFVLDQLEEIDLDTHRALYSTVSEFRSAQQATSLKELLQDLQRGWVRRVQRKLGRRKIEVIRGLLEHPVPDLLAMFRRGHDENAHSDVIRWLLDPRKAKSVAPAALAKLVEGLEEQENWKALMRAAIEQDSLSVRREFTIGREWTNEETLDRIDLVVQGPGFVLAIENKVWSGEHDDQTEAYWRWLATLDSVKGALFLSPAGRPPACSSFKALSYIDLVSCLTEAASTSTVSDEERTVLAGYLKTLERHVLRAELRAVRENGDET